MKLIFLTLMCYSAIQAVPIISIQGNASATPTSVYAASGNFGMLFSHAGYSDIYQVIVPEAAVQIEAKFFYDASNGGDVHVYIPNGPNSYAAIYLWSGWGHRDEFRQVTPGQAITLGYDIYATAGGNIGYESAGLYDLTYNFLDDSGNAIPLNSFPAGDIATPEPSALIPAGILLILLALKVRRRRYLDLSTGLAPLRS